LNKAPPLGGLPREEIAADPENHGLWRWLLPPPDFLRRLQTINATSNIR